MANLAEFCCGDAAVRKRAKPDRHIHMFLNQMHIPIAEHETDVDLRVVGQEIRHHWQHVQTPKNYGRRYGRSPLGALYSPAAVRSASVTCSRILFATLTYAAPASVSTNLRVERISNRVPRCDSRSAIFRLTVGSGTFILRPTADKLPTAATSIAIASRRSTQPPTKREGNLQIYLIMSNPRSSY